MTNIGAGAEEKGAPAPASKLSWKGLVNIPSGHMVSITTQTCLGGVKAAADDPPPGAGSAPTSD